jgi:hypothetical protein
MYISIIVCVYVNLCGSRSTAKIQVVGGGGGDGEGRGEEGGIERTRTVSLDVTNTMHESESTRVVAVKRCPCEVGFLQAFSKKRFKELANLTSVMRNAIECFFQTIDWPTFPFQNHVRSSFGKVEKVPSNRK